LLPVTVVPLTVVNAAVVPTVVVPVKEVNVPVVAANELAVALVTTFKPVSVALSAKVPLSTQLNCPAASVESTYPDVPSVRGR
jgi:hypothetical protein